MINTATKRRRTAVQHLSPHPARNARHSSRENANDPCEAAPTLNLPQPPTSGYQECSGKARRRLASLERFYSGGAKYDLMNDLMSGILISPVSRLLPIELSGAQRNCVKLEIGAPGDLDLAVPVGPDRAEGVVPG